MKKLLSWIKITANVPRIAARLGKTKNKLVLFLRSLFKKIFTKSKPDAQVAAMRCYAPPSLSDDKFSIIWSDDFFTPADYRPLVGNFPNL